MALGLPGGLLGRDLRSQRELWQEAAASPSLGGLAGAPRAGHLTPREVLAQSADARQLIGHLEKRSQALFALELSAARPATSPPSSAAGPSAASAAGPAAGSAAGRSGAPAAAGALGDFGEEASLEGPQARPPHGSGYVYPGPCAARPTLVERLGRHPAASPSKGDGGGDAKAFSASRAGRIRDLMHAMERHEEEKLARLGRGTAPLLGAQGDAILPVPPAEAPQESRLRLGHRLRLVREARQKVSPEAALRAKMMGEQVLGADAGQRSGEEVPSWAAPRYAGALPRVLANIAAARLAEAACSGATQPKGALPPGPQLRQMGAEALLRAAECMVAQGASEEEWRRLSAQLGARASEAAPAEVLRMARAVAAAARSGRMEAAGKAELLRAAEHLIQSLAGRLLDASVEVLADVVEAMADARVGSQEYLDMLMSLALACHHRDCQALSPSMTLRLGTALGRVAAATHLRPQGVGGTSTGTNRKLLEVVERRLAEGLEACRPADLARLDEYYLTRLCCDQVRRAAVARMAELQLGLRAATSEYLPLMVRLNDALQRELGDGFAWSVPKSVRDYLAHLRQVGLQARAW